jgi:hypothetical protein
MLHILTHKITTIALGVSFALASNMAAAQDTPSTSPVVVELYTSQGCSSCPPADALLTELAKRDDIIPLALHVDYWDYIGWKDVFASPGHADRQRAYARVAGKRMIYTPQMIVNGMDHVVGYKPANVEAAIEASRNALVGIPVSLIGARDDNSVHVEVQDLGDLPAAMRLQMVEFSTTDTVDIKTGENRGKSLTYSNIVQKWQRMSDWAGGDPLVIDLALESENPVAVILQEITNEGPGQILAALRLN